MAAQADVCLPLQLTGEGSTSYCYESWPSPGSQLVYTLACLITQFLGPFVLVRITLTCLLYSSMRRDGKRLTQRMRACAIFFLFFMRFFKGFAFFKSIFCYFCTILSIFCTYFVCKLFRLEVLPELSSFFYL